MYKKLYDEVAGETSSRIRQNEVSALNHSIKLMREAADEEDSVEKRPVTPGAIIPAREQLGDLFLELNLPKDALPEFERALTITPNRHGGVNGRDRAQELVNTGGKVEED